VASAFGRVRPRRGPRPGPPTTLKCTQVVEDSVAWSGAFLVSAGVLMLLLAGWLLVLNPRSRLHRAFAIFLVLRSVVNILPGLLGLGVDDGVTWSSLSLGVCWMALPAAGAYLIVALLAYVKGQRPSAAWAWICLVVGAAGVAVFLLDPELLFYQDGDVGTRAPLDWWANGRFLVYGVFGWIFARQFAANPRGSEGRASYLASLGIILNAAHLSVVPFVGFFADDLGRQWGPSSWAIAVVYVATFVVVVATLAQLARVAIRVPSTRPGVTVYATLVLLAMASRVPIDILAYADPNNPTLPGMIVLIDGIWTLFMPILVAHAILRHGIFGTQKRVTLTLQRGTVAAMLLAAFFVATEMANNFFQVRGGWIFGSVAAGIMLFAAAPLQRAAERLTQLPPGRSSSTPSTAPAIDRVEIYRDHLRVVWADGTLSSKERVLLRLLRDKLGLSPADADRLEEEVLGA